MDYIKRFRVFAILALLCLALAGCTKGGDDVQPVQPGPLGTPTAAVTGAPTATPEPTPIIDILHDGTTVRTAEEENEPMVVTREAIGGYLNPFGYSDETDAELVELTQLKLLYVDDEGKASAGIEYPCYAYALDTVDSADIDRETPEGYTTYRLTLKKGLAFSDGLQMTPEDAIFSLYMLSDPLYSGVSTLSAVDIYGMDEYHSQVPHDIRTKVESIVSAGLNEDGSYPSIEGISEEEQAEVWACFEAGGAIYARNLIEAVNNDYPMDAYVNAFLSENVTYAMVQESESLRTAYACVFAGYGAKTGNPYNLWGGNYFKDYQGNVYKFDEVEFTEVDLWNIIFGYYGYDFSDEGINYDRTCARTELPTIEECVAEAYYSTISGCVTDIAGVWVEKDAVTDEDGAVRDALYVQLGEDVSPALINFYVAPWRYYTAKYDGELDEHMVVIGDETFMHDVLRRKSALLGAGEYALESLEEGRVALIANENYLLGAPARMHLEYTCEVYEIPGE